MSENKLPVLKEKNLPSASGASALEVIKGLRTNRALLAGALVLSGGAVGVFVLTQYTILSVVLAVLGVVVFGARQLVKKSLSITASTSSMAISSTQGRLEEIKKQASKCKFLEKVEIEGSRLASQADQLLRQYKNLKGVLSQKFETTELTYSRYVDGIENSCLSLGENILHAKDTLENLNATNKNDSGNWQKQLDHVSELLRVNDHALEELATLFNSINEINTKEKHRPQLEESMQKIRELAERAKVYSKH